MSGIRRLILLNQATGPLFRQLAEGLSSRYPDGGLLVTGGARDGARIEALAPKLQVRAAPPYDRRSRLHRLLSWLRYVLRATRHVLLSREGDAVLFVSNPPLLGPWVWLLRHLRRVPYAVLVYDIHPDVLVRLGVLNDQGWPARIWRALNRRVYRRARAVVTIGNRMAAVLQRQVGADGPKVAVVPPWVDVGAIRPLPREQNPYADSYTPSGPVVVLYSGNMGASHDIDSILEATRQLRDEPGIFFLLIGEGEKHAEAVAFTERHQLTRVRVFPFQPEDRLPFTLPLGDLALVSLDEGMEDLMVPSKAFSYLAAGSALIAIANEPSELSDVLEQGAVGVRVGPRQPHKLAEVIRTLAADSERLTAMRAEARRLAVNRYSREAGVDAFAQVLDGAGLGPAPKRG
jgi:glycosyltransferase involved in cell wall biosynthesis